MGGRDDRYRPHWRRRRAGGLALLLVVVGLVAAPLVDGWLHASEGAPAAQDAGDCVVHKLAGTQLVGTAGAPAFVTPRSDDHRDAIPAPRAPHHARGDRLTPPSRAPPA